MVDVKVSAEHDLDRSRVDADPAQPIEVARTQPMDFSRARLRLAAHRALFFKYRPRQAGRLGLSRLPELKSCHTEHAFEVNLW